MVLNSFSRLWDPDFKVNSKSHVDFGPLHSGPVLYLLSPGMMVLRLPLVQEWLEARDATLVAHFLDTSVHGGSWCTNSIHCLWSFPQVLEFTVDQRNLPVTQGLSSNAIHVACAPLPTNPPRASIFCTSVKSVFTTMVIGALLGTVSQIQFSLSDKKRWTFPHRFTIFCKP